ncbi:hypothetical protein DFH08DRAFT_1026333 [Mycena albidolilacea]|uniref:Uncharacterized protein n=1 Tax=Mycena albidolilacea TaxID=1033008 RepID=A0AAD6ZKN3_9AGAR|nr:hypothetical protein DFH08DRAFT_1026333 [Mycena albidolilacea]
MGRVWPGAGYHYFVGRPTFLLKRLRRRRSGFQKWGECKEDGEAQAATATSRRTTSIDEEEEWQQPLYSAPPLSPHPRAPPSAGSAQLELESKQRLEDTEEQRLSLFLSFQFEWSGVDTDVVHPYILLPRVAAPVGRAFPVPPSADARRDLPVLPFLSHAYHSYSYPACACASVLFTPTPSHPEAFAALTSAPLASFGKGDTIYVAFPVLPHRYASTATPTPTPAPASISTLNLPTLPGMPPMVWGVSSPSAPVRTSPVPEGKPKASARGRGAALRSAVPVLALLHIRCIDDADDAAVSDTLRTLINEYHLNGSKSTLIKNDALAHIALLRSKAAPLAVVAITQKAVKGADTGFWKAVNVELKNTTRIHGTNREAAGWKEWEDAIIRADRGKYVASTASVDVDEDSGSDEEPEDEDEGAGLTAVGLEAQAQIEAQAGTAKV